MVKDNCQLLVVTNLDEIAWLLNLRGSDIKYNPVFFAYVVVTPQEIHLFIDSHRLEKNVREHLKLDSKVDCECDGVSKASYGITVHPYAELMPYLQDTAADENNLVKGGILAGGKDGGKAWVSDRSSQALASVFMDHQRLTPLT